MSEEKQMTLYVEDHATTLVSRYEQDFQSYKTSLDLSQKDRQIVSRRSYGVTKVLVGSFLALSAIALVGGSNYLMNRAPGLTVQADQTSADQSWVFPVYFIAGIFSVSSVLSFKQAIK